ncbi:hypothetical protein R2Q81_06860 [Microbacterium aquimaris]|uniref:hypothetical protein n=1 Tax=Microbacterium aquimaris TaxID=459816 RepID=UPI002AD52BBA|nr:hypothetical protein [Microbacterium aquimaris]MDZ8275672.1 hypothetical protein [Microbacterium aquimaris]
MSNPIIAARGRLGYAKKIGDTTRITEASRDLAAEKLAHYIQTVVASAPPLTTAQRDRLATLLRSPEPPREVRRPKSVNERIAGGVAE